MNAVAELIAAATRVVPLISAVELNPRPDRAALPDDLEVSFVPMAAVEAGSGRLDATAIRRFGEVKKGYTIFREGDVLFAKITPCMENGKMAVARSLRYGVGCGSTEFHVLRPKPGVEPQYVYYFVSSARFRAEAAHHMTGAVGQKRVPAAFLEQCEIPLPDLDDQRHIVAELEKQFSRLDEAVANLKRVKVNLKRYKAAVLKAAVEGSMDSGQLRSPSSAAEALLKQVLAERRERWRGRGAYREPAAGEPFTEFPLPPGWTSATIEQLAWSVEYGSSAKTSEAERGVPVLRMGNIVEGEIDYAELKYLPCEHNEFPRLLLEPGDLLFNRTNSPELVGKTAVFRGDRRCSFASYLIRVKTVSCCIPEFVAAYINSVHGRAWVKSVVTQQVGQANVNGTKLQALLIPLPPLAVQTHIVAEIDRRLSIVREVDAEVDANLRRAEVLRQAALSRWFSMRTRDGLPN